MGYNPQILQGLTNYFKGGKDPVPTGTIKVHGKPGENTADIRDSISALVGSGYSGGVTDEKLRAHVSRIMGLLPQKEAQNLLTHISVYNRNPNNLKLIPTQRVSNFYDINPADPGTLSIIQQAKSFGTGVLGGLNSTPEQVGMEVTNRLPVNPLIVKK